MSYVNYGTVRCATCSASVTDGKMMDLTEDTSLIYCEDCASWREWEE